MTNQAKSTQAGSRYITVEGVRYLIRGNCTAAELHRRYAAFAAKFQTANLSFVQWAVERGAVYFKVR